MLLDKNAKVGNVKAEIITFVIQLCVKSVVVTYDECQVQAIRLVIQLLAFSGFSSDG